MENRRKLNLLLILFLILTNILVWQALFNLGLDNSLEVIFFDVGQGDAVFIETPYKHQILIDGGPDSKILEKLTKEMPFWDRTIDLIILTHPEKDHLAGLLEVLERYKVEQILWTGVIRDTAEYNKWQELIKKEKAKITIAQAPQRIKAGRVSLNILYPFESLEGEKLEESNDTSIIFRLIFGDDSFLFTGDVEKSVEKKILSECREEVDCLLGSDVLKVSHHGSKTSTSEEFLKEVSPEVAIISCGRNNSYGHPHQETLDILEKYGIRIFRTDLNGDIKIISDGKNYAISSF
jgi:competence protein ComEC